MESLRRRLDDLAVLHELAVAEDDAATLAEADRELEALTRAIGELEVRTSFRPVRQSRSTGDDQLASRWGRRRGLGTDAAAHVHPLGGATWLLSGDLRHLVRGRSRHQVGDIPGQGAVRLRHAVGRARHPPPGPDQSLRQPGSPPDVVRRVDVTPVVETSDHVDIDDKDLRVDVYRSSGPGGQGSTPRTPPYG